MQLLEQKDDVTLTVRELGLDQMTDRAGRNTDWIAAVEQASSWCEEVLHIRCLIVHSTSFQSSEHIRR